MDEKSVVGNYILKGRKSIGIFSECWIGEHLYLEKKEVIIKIFKDKNFLENLKLQKKIKLIDCPYVVNIIDYNPLNNPPYLIQNLIEGVSLRELLKKHKKFSPGTSLNILKKIVKSLLYLHKYNYPHLDLRPENIVIDRKENIFLLDYFLGNAVTLTLADYYLKFAKNTMNVPGAIMRSLLYKGKEQRLGKDLSLKADIYSLGIILFEMITGIYPTKKADLPSMVVPGIPSKIDKIYINCCKEKKYESCEDVLNAITSKEIMEEDLSTSGIKPLRKGVAIISVATLAGGKHYVDRKNISILVENLDNIIKSDLMYLALNFSNIDYLNSSALGYLVNFADQIKENGGEVVMFNVAEKVFTILSALGLEKVIKILKNEAEAKAYILTLASKK